MSLGEYLGSGSGITKGLWHLNGNSTDSSGNGNNGTDTSITYSLANGKFNQGAGFNGTTSLISLADTSSLHLTSAITLSAWIKTSYTANYQLIFSELETYTGGNYLGYYLIINQTTGFASFNTGNNNTSVTSTTDNVNLCDGAWRNIIVTYDGSTTRFYNNGVATVSGANTRVPTYPNTIYPRIGVWYASRLGNNYFFNGSMDEVIVEGSIWSAEKVKKYYTYTKGRFGI